MEKPKIYIDYTSSEKGGEKEEPGKMFSFREPIYIELKINELLKTVPSNFWVTELECDSSILNCPNVFLVVVRYQSGNSFGTSHGNFHFFSVRATKEEALKDKEDIEQDKVSGYKPWKGYFEKLEDIEIHHLPLVE